MKSKKTLLQKILSTAFVYLMIITIMAITVSAEHPASMVDLGTAGDFAVLSKVAITSASASVDITGDIGVSPASGTFITLACSELTGTIWQVDAGLVTPCAIDGTANSDAGKTYVDNAILALGTAYTAATGGENTPASGASYLNLGAGTLTSRTLTPGVYSWDSTLDITGDITLDCEGNSSEVFVFQVGTDLNLATTNQIILAGGCQASRIFWAVGGTTMLHEESHLEGTVITGPGTTEITFIASTPGASVNGRILGAKTIALQDNSAIAMPVDTAPSTSSVTSTFITTTTATIDWTTDVFSNSTVSYGTDEFNLDTFDSNSSLVMDHTILLSGLTSSTTYYFDVTSCDDLGNCDTSGVYNFTTSTSGGITIGDSSNITTTLTNVTVTINGVDAINGMNVSGTNPINIMSNGLQVINFNYNFDASSLNFSDLNISNGISSGAAYFVVTGINSTGSQVGTKTVYMYDVNTSFNGLCVQDIADAAIPSVTCDGVNEFLLSCNGVTDSNGITCTKSSGDTILTIDGLKNSGMIQQNVPSTLTVVNLGTAGNFVVLAKTGVSVTGVTMVTGNIGLSPAAASYVTGFGLIMDVSNKFSTSSLVNGSIYAADYTAPTPSIMTTAVGDMEIAYADAAGRTLPDHTELGAGNIGGMTLAPGLYKWDSGVTIPTDVTLAGNSSDVWIFQIAQTLDIANGKQIILSGGAQSKNIFWQVAGQATLGTDSVFNGDILSQTGVILNNGATLNGRALAQTAVTLDANTVSSPTAEVSVLTNLTLEPTSTNLTLNVNGTELQLNATGVDQFGLPMATTILFTSSNLSVATVNATTGLVTALVSGTTTITATSGAKTATSVIEIITAAPVLSTIGSRSVTQETWINLTLTATSPGEFNLTYNLSGKPTTATFTDNYDGTAVFNWLPNSSNIGVNQVTFTVTDGMKTTSEVVAITVNLFQAPTTTSVYADNAWINTDRNVTLNAVGFNNTTVLYINYTLNGVQGQINGSNGNVFINTSGENVLVFYAVDNSSNVETPTTTLITLDKIAPSITSFTLSNDVVLRGLEITGTCTATDNYDASPNTVITGIDTSVAGTKTATCTATDAAGNTDTETLSYIVNRRSSGGGNYNPTSESSQSSFFSEMTRGVHIVYIGDEGVAITTMKIELNGVANNVEITTTQLSGKPSSILTPQLENIYAYLQIEHINLNNSIIDNVKMQFRVEKAWMTRNNVDPSNINLYRYTSNWDLLDTVLISEDSTYYYFESDSPGLSYFVIGTPLIETTPATTTPTTTTPTGTGTAVPPKDNNLITGLVAGGNWIASPWGIGSLLFILLLIIAAMIIVLPKRGKKKAVSVVSTTTNSNPFGKEDVHPVVELEGIGPEYSKALLAIGIEDTKQLWEANATKVSQRTGAPLASVKSWQNMAELSCVKDIGPQYSELLERSGVHNIKQLKGYDTTTLLKLVRKKENSLKINIQGNTPGHDLVKNWIDQARKHKFSSS